MIRKEIRSSLFMNYLTKFLQLPLSVMLKLTQSLSILNMFQKMKTIQIMKTINCSSYNIGSLWSKNTKSTLRTAQHLIKHEKKENKTKEEILLKIKDLLLIMSDKEIANGKSKAKFEKNGKNSLITAVMAGNGTF